MTIVAFDAKEFHRGKIIHTQEDGKTVQKYSGFNSPLGIGVVFSDDDKFSSKYISKTAELRDSFGIEEKIPLISSSYVKQALGLRKAIAFADQLIIEVQNYIDSIHCSYVILPPAKIASVSVGGFKCPVTQIPINYFIDNLYPMFSYLTAYSYLYRNGFSTEDLELHIDAFRSKLTPAWENIIQKTSPKIYLKGDECNPFISCADMIAFLTDAKLYDQRLKLEPQQIQKAWNVYSFKTEAHFFDEKTLNLYSWKTRDNIDYSKYLVKPTIFLAVDNIEKKSYADSQSEPLSEQIGVRDETKIDSAKTTARKFNQVIKRSEVYYAALRYAYSKNGSMKIFSKDDDMPLVQDGDVFVYVGIDSEKIGKSFQHAYDIEVLSGLDLKKKVKQLGV